MKMKNKFTAAGICGLLTTLLIIAIRFVDVRAIGPEGTRVGLSQLNQYVLRLFGVQMLWYEITDWLGVTAILVAALFAAAGVIQMVRRKSIRKVDREVLALGGLYVIVIGLYILFETFVVNYRPVIMPGSAHPESSFPSSHTMLVCVIMGSALQLIEKYMKRRRLRIFLKAGCSVIIGVTVIGRLVSGVHWFTDILGGILISAMLLSLYAGILEKMGENA